MSRFSPAARRIVARCRELVCDQPSPDVWSAHLVLALLLDESLASAGLRALGITREWIAAGNLGPEAAASDARAKFQQPLNADAECDPSPSGNATDFRDVTDPDEFVRILDRAASLRRSAADRQQDSVSSTHLLVALVETSDFVRGRFANAGVLAADIRRESACETHDRLPQIPADFQLKLGAEADATATPARTDSGQPSGSDPEPPTAAIPPDAPPDAPPVAPSGTPPLPESLAVWRVIDANLNRAREGLRVLEDHARFIENDAACSRQLKVLRHELVHSESRLTAGRSGSAGGRTALQHRDTLHDVGTGLTTDGEVQRQSPQDIVTANCRRVQESLRSLEEFGKLVSVPFAADMKQFRYRMYELEQTLLRVSGPSETAGQCRQASPLLTDRRHRLETALLYVLVTESACRLPWKQFVQEILRGGADVVQLREKHLPDRELVERSRWLSDACRDSGALCIINDRPEVAALSGADGVHVGQDEITPPDARRILDRDQLLGVSTHDIRQARAAVDARADYLGVGPVFPSVTRAFADFPGLPYVGQVAQEVQLPWFAIGGVTLQRLEELWRAGASRVAVCSALADAGCPAEATRGFREQLKTAGRNWTPGPPGAVQK